MSDLEECLSDHTILNEQITYQNVPARGFVRFKSDTFVVECSFSLYRYVLYRTISRQLPETVITRDCESHVETHSRTVHTVQAHAN